MGKLRECMDEFNSLYVFSFEHMRSAKFKDVRIDWRDSRCVGRPSVVWVCVWVCMGVVCGGVQRAFRACLPPSIIHSIHYSYACTWHCHPQKNNPPGSYWARTS